MADEGMQFHFEISKVPDPNGFVCRSGGQDELGGRVERQRVDGVLVAVYRLCRARRGAGRSRIKDLECEIVGNGADEGWMERVMLDVIDYGGMVGVGPGGM